MVTHIFNKHAAAQNLLRYCEHCKKSVIKSPQHMIDHMNLEPVVLCADKYTATRFIFAVPLINELGSIVDSYIGFSASSITDLMTQKLRKFDHVANVLPMKRCTEHQTE